MVKPLECADQFRLALRQLFRCAARGVDGRFDGCDIGVGQKYFEFGHGGGVVAGTDAQDVLGVRVAECAGGRLPRVKIAQRHHCTHVHRLWYIGIQGEAGT